MGIYNTAITFNAAGLDWKTELRYGILLNFDKGLQGYIVKNEPLDYFHHNAVEGERHTYFVLSKPLLMKPLLILLTSLLCNKLTHSQSVSTPPPPGIYTGGGSVILTIVDRDSIILMADSRQSFDNKMPSSSVNKINTYQNIFYAQAGTSVLVKNGEKILDLNDTLGNIIKTNKFRNIPKVYKEFLNTAIKTYVDKYHVRLHLFTNHDDKDSFVCKISIIKYNNKSPQYIFGSFLLTETRRRFYVRFVEDYNPSSFPFVNKSGNLTIIQNFLAKNPGYFDSTEGLIDKCIHLIKLTAKALPGEVGCPIKVVIIKPSGVRWLGPVEDCSFKDGSK